MKSHFRAENGGIKLSLNPIASLGETGWQYPPMVKLEVCGFTNSKVSKLEVAVLSTDWLTLIINGVLLRIIFRRQLKAEQKS